MSATSTGAIWFSGRPTPATRMPPININVANETASQAIGLAKEREVAVAITGYAALIEANPKNAVSILTKCSRRAIFFRIDFAVANDLVAGTLPTGQYCRG